MIKWIEIPSTDTERLTAYAAEMHVNPLALEDCLHREQRPKLDDYGSHQLLVWFMLYKGEIYEIQFLIFPDQLIAVPHVAAPDGKTWQEFLRITNQHKDVWHLLYHALDRATDLTWQEVRQLFTQIDDFEEEMFHQDLSPQTLLALKKQLNQIDYSVGHLSSVAEQLLNLCNPTGDLIWKLRDLHDHCERINRSIPLYRSQTAATIELYWGLQANRTNGQIKKLTLLASIAVPLTFWASFWGMNFQFIPFHRPELFFGAIVIMISSVALTTWFLIRKGYWQD